MNIIQYPNPILSEKIDYITDFDSAALKKAVDSCVHYLQHSSMGSAIGVAANQLGFKFRFFVFYHRNQLNVVYNPRIIAESKLFEKSDEGCLSFADPEKPFCYESKTVYRPEKITVAFRVSEDEFCVKDFSGDLKNIFCHEIDHLNGKTILDRTLPSTHVE